MTKYMLFMIIVWLLVIVITNYFLQIENPKLFKIAESLEKVILGATIAISILWIAEYP